MNKVVLMGRLTRDIEVRYSQGETPLAIARYTLAVPRRFKREGEAEADFINCVAFGKAAEFAEKYFRQGTKIVVCGRIQTGSYTNKEGNKVYTTDIVIEEQDFAESKNASEQTRNMQGTSNYNSSSRNTSNDGDKSNQGDSYQQESFTGNDGFMKIPDGIDEELPFY